MKYYSSTDIGAVALSHAETEAVLVDAFRAARSGGVAMPPRTNVAIPDGARFVSFPSTVFHAGTRVAALKWVGISASKGHNLDAVLLLSDPDTGKLQAILDAQWITLGRTAAVTLIAARLAASAKSNTVSFLACGRQAEAHLELLRGAFPFTAVRAYSRTLETAERFARHARDAGLDAHAFSSMQECVEGADIVISSLPARPAEAEPCTAQWFTKDCFVALVDLGRAFDGDPGKGFSTVVVDDVAQYEALSASGLVAPTTAPHIALTALLDQRTSHNGRTLLIPTGCGYLDAALGLRLVERADARGLGTLLPT